MAINVDGKVLRNLQEQVLENKQRIEDHYNRDRIIADFGIRVIGQVSSVDDIPEGEYQYGDAFAVGTEPPYSFYIWTRADEDAGHPDDYFLNIGALAIVGPEGPIGPKGDPGERGTSTQWYAMATDPYGTGYREGDCWLNTRTGMVYWYNGEFWEAQSSIQGPAGMAGLRGEQGETGPQGPKGEKGDTGDVGGFINIWGTVENTGLLPSPTVIKNLTAAYLVGEEKNLYIQVGQTSETAQWTNMGPMNAATLVTVNGSYQNVWDSDTKLDKVTQSTGYDQAYIKNANGTQAMIEVAAVNRAGAIVKRDNSSHIQAVNAQRAVLMTSDDYVLTGKDLSTCSAFDNVGGEDDYEAVYIGSGISYMVGTGPLRGKYDLNLNINLFGDRDPQWQITFVVGQDFDLVINSQHVGVPNDEWPEWEEGHLYTIVLYPIIYNSLNGLGPGNKFSGPVAMVTVDYGELGL